MKCILDGEGSVSLPAPDKRVGPRNTEKRMGPLIALAVAATLSCAARCPTRPVNGGRAALLPVRCADRVVDNYGNPTIGFADFSFGRVFLPPGWAYEPGVGVDTGVGALEAPLGGLVIRYDHGNLAGLYADPAQASQYTWFRSERVASLTMYSAYRDGVVLITFIDGETPRNLSTNLRRPSSKFTVALPPSPAASWVG